jgi:hypothetical protein
MADKKMVSMKRTMEDRRHDAGEGPGIEAVAPDYPYGLCIRLEGDELDRLGMKQLPQVGTEIPITIKVKVTRVSQSAADNGEGEYDEMRCVELQITDMAIG